MCKFASNSVSIYLFSYYFLSSPVFAILPAILACLHFINFLLISHKSPLVGHLINFFAQQKVTSSKVKSLPVKLVIVLTLTECWCRFRKLLVSAPICIFWFLFNIYFHQLFDFFITHRWLQDNDTLFWFQCVLMAVGLWKSFSARWFQCSYSSIDFFMIHFFFVSRKENSIWTR
jgi:hypothetical protein